MLTKFRVRVELVQLGITQSPQTLILLLELGAQEEEKWALQEIIM